MMENIQGYSLSETEKLPQEENKFMFLRFSSSKFIP